MSRVMTVVSVVCHVDILVVSAFAAIVDVISVVKVVIAVVVSATKHRTIT